jgi:trehalose 6-phosphate phosphatase
MSDEPAATDGTATTDEPAASDGTTGTDGTAALEDPAAALGDRVAAAPGVLCCLDFDGTLASIVDEPDEATLSPACGEPLRRLVARSTVDVAVVSGRALRDLEERVGVDGVTYAGNHGLELRRDGERQVHPGARDRRPAVREVSETIADQTVEIDGVRVEDKGVTATVHYRQVADADVPDVVATVDRVVDAADAALGITEGKAIREIRPRVDWDKGRVVQQLLDEVPDDWLPVYVGDDTTDEDAFEVVEPDGIGVHVGDDETAASYRVPDQSDVADLLTAVAERTG